MSDIHAATALSVKVATYRAYNADLGDFSAWLSEHGLWPRFGDPIEADILLADYFADRFDEAPQRGTLQHCRNIHAAVLMAVPHYRGSLGRSARVLRGWDSAVPPKPSLPATRGVTLGIAYHMFSSGRDAAAVVTLLAFECYFRIHEVLRLDVSDILWRGHPLLGPDYAYEAGIRIGKAKTGQNQFVAVRDPLVAAVLRRYLAGRTSGPVFPLNYDSYRACLDAACKALQLPHLTAHSFRRGGATQDYLDGKPIDYVQDRGRWKVRETCKLYVDMARALLVTMAISPVVSAWLENLVKAPHLFFAMWK